MLCPLGRDVAERPERLGFGHLRVRERQAPGRVGAGWNDRCHGVEWRNHTAPWRDELIRDLIGSGTLVQGLRDGLDASAARSREIAHRVANATNETTASFDVVLDDALADGEVDLETEMVSLADEQIRFEAVSEILSKMYVQIRSSIRGA